MDAKQSIASVLMLPWLAHGHISPFLELAKKLSHRNLYIYLCSTPINLNSIKKRITEKYSHSIELVEIHLPSLPELPPHNHTTNGLPNHLIPTLKTAFEMAIPSFTNILKTLSPDLLIYDFNQPWAPTIASSYNIPAVDFISSGATMPSFTLHLRMKGGVEFPFPAIQLQGFHKLQFGNMIKTAANRAKNKEGPLDAMKRSCNIILFHTFRELEGQYVDYLAILVEKKIVPVGSLVREIDDEDDHAEIIEWLDNKDESSTVFVSFGSESFMSKDEIEEIAHGLELSKVNFIWVVRFPVGEKVEIEEALPKGFLERLGERGMVVEGWAPQARILTHSSIGGFVSHCGWNSVMESLKFGVPIVAMPMHYDQPFNARLVEEIGAAVEVNRDINGRLNREDIAQVIRTVVVEESGEDIRIKAREYSEKIRMKGEEEIDEVVEELLQLCKLIYLGD
nr:UGT94E5 [Camellia japonica]